MCVVVIQLNIYYILIILKLVFVLLSDKRSIV